MRHEKRASAARATMGLLASSILIGCTQAPDLAAVDAERQKPVQRYDIMQALAANDKVVVAATQGGAALISKDSGKTWSRQSLGPVSLIGLATCPDGSFVGIDFYRKVWSTDPAGTSWKSHVLDKPKTPLTVTCDKKGNWWVGGTRAVLAASSDKGASWKVTDLGEDTQITALQFIDETHGIAAGEFGMVLKTVDGGANWTKQPPIAGEFYPYAVLFVNRDEGWLSGIAGTLLHTTDGGTSWATQANVTRAPLYRLFAHQGVAYGVGAAGVVARYVGGSWQAMPYTDAVPVFLAAGTSLDKQDAIVVGGPGGLVRTLGTHTN